jgi:hypothetical protein
MPAHDPKIPARRSFTTVNRLLCRLRLRSAAVFRFFEGPLDRPRWLRLSRLQQESLQYLSTTLAGDSDSRRQ